MTVNVSVCKQAGMYDRSGTGGTLPHGRRADALFLLFFQWAAALFCLKLTLWPLSEKFDVILEIPSIDAYLLEEQSCQINFVLI